MKAISLETIARDVCVIAGDLEFTQLPTMVRLGATACNDIHLGIAPNIKSEWMKVNANSTVDLPAAAQSVTKVGRLTQNGVLVCFYEQDSLRIDAKNISEACGAPDETSPTGDSLYPWWLFYNVFWNGRFGELYGASNDPSMSGTWRHNKPKNILEIGGSQVSPGDEILVEYVDISSERFKLIPEEARAVMIHRILYYYNLDSNPQKAMMQFQQFAGEYNRLKSLYLRQHPRDLLRSFMRGQKSVPK